MHGMMQDWHSEYELLKPLEENYMLIVPAMDGFYDGSPEFTCFADQAKKIEDYVIANHNGRLFGAYGASQGALIPSGKRVRSEHEAVKQAEGSALAVPYRKQVGKK